MATQTIDREMQISDEAEEARWVDAMLDQLDAAAGPPPF
jgi:hypothetical protein